MGAQHVCFMHRGLQHATAEMHAHKIATVRAFQLLDWTPRGTTCNTDSIQSNACHSSPGAAVWVRHAELWVHLR